VHNIRLLPYAPPEQPCRHGHNRFTSGNHCPEPRGVVPDHANILAIVDPLSVISEIPPARRDCSAKPILFLVCCRSAMFLAIHGPFIPTRIGRDGAFQLASAF